jgi:nicotinate-nucleotide adenylyltransferase
MKKILFYPGTFNPPHLGHASAVLVALKNLAFDEVWILPSGKRVDREIPTSVEDRRKLSALFVDYLQTQIQIPVRLIADALDGVGGKYTHEVIVDLKSRSKDEIYQLSGTDGFTSIKERVIGPHEKFVIIKRLGYEFPEGLVSKNNLLVLEEEVGGVSSTKIREMVKSGDEGYKKLVPKEISSYIEEKGLYL